MVMLPEISTSTAHRRLTALRQKGMVDLVPDEEDRRTKYLVATKATHRYFAQLGKCMGGSKTAPADCARQYIKYLHLTQAVRGLPIYQDMDANDIVMLDTWAVAWQDDLPMGVLKALSLIDNRGAANAAYRLHGLRELGLIELVRHGYLKHVVPTTATQDYVVHLGRCMHQALAE
jgi:hypothetical protein